MSQASPHHLSVKFRLIDVKLLRSSRVQQKVSHRGMCDPDAVVGGPMIEFRIEEMSLNRISKSPGSRERKARIDHTFVKGRACVQIRVVDGCWRIKSPRMKSIVSRFSFGNVENMCIYRASSSANGRSLSDEGGFSPSIIFNRSTGLCRSEEMYLATVEAKTNFPDDFRTNCQRTSLLGHACGINDLWGCVALMFVKVLSRSKEMSSSDLNSEASSARRVETSLRTWELKVERISVSGRLATRTFRGWWHFRTACDRTSRIWWWIR